MPGASVSPETWCLGAQVTVSFHGHPWPYQDFALASNLKPLQILSLNHNASEGDKTVYPLG